MVVLSSGDIWFVHECKCEAMEPFYHCPCAWVQCVYAIVPSGVPHVPVTCYDCGGGVSRDVDLEAVGCPLLDWAIVVYHCLLVVDVDKSGGGPGVPFSFDVHYHVI